MVSVGRCSILSFQSTRPARGATLECGAGRDVQRCFNPRAPRGARRKVSARIPAFSCFNPRAPRGARRDQGPHRLHLDRVSIHAPRAGRDALRTAPIRHRLYCFNPRAPRGARRHGRDGTVSLRLSFNPRAPRGARPQPITVITRYGPFQSTRPARGATRGPPTQRRDEPVSIHAPRAGRDHVIIFPCLPDCEFQSTRPARGATNPSSRWLAHAYSAWFQSTRPARGATAPILTDVF